MGDAASSSSQSRRHLPPSPLPLATPLAIPRAAPFAAPFAAPLLHPWLHPLPHALLHPLPPSVRPSTSRPSTQVRAQLGDFFGGASYTNHTTRAVDMAQWRRYRRDRPMTERTTRLQHHLSQFVHMRTCAKLVEAREVLEGFHHDPESKPEPDPDPEP